MSCTELLVSQRGVPSRAVHWLSHRVVFQVVQCTGCPLEFLGVPWISLRFPGVCIALAIIVITIIIVITFVIDMFAITYAHEYNASKAVIEMLKFPETAKNFKLPPDIYAGIDDDEGGDDTM